MGKAYSDRQRRDGTRPPAPTWTDEEMIQVLAVQGYITRAEFKDPDFVGLAPCVDSWWEACIRHAVAKSPVRRREARARLIRLARRIEQIKIEWAEGPQNAAVRERLVVTNRQHRRILKINPGR